MAASTNVMLNNLCDKSLTYEDLVLHLRRFDDSQIFNFTKSNLHDTIGKMHTFLHTASNRTRGLLIMTSLINQCNAEDLNQHMSSWLKVIIHILQSKEPLVVLKLTCHVCCQIIKISPCHISMKKAMQTFIPQLIPLLLGASSEWRRHSIAVLNACITHYGGACGPFKSKVEELVKKELQSGSLTKESVLCFCLLACCGTSGNQRVKYTEGWSSQVSHLLTDLHSITDHIYRDLPNSGLPMSDVDSITESFGAVDPVTHFNILMQCLQKMLRKSFPALIKLPIERILHFVDKVLSVDDAQLKIVSLMNSSLLILHRDAVDVVDALYESCKKLMLPYNKKVIRVLTRELIWTSSDSVYTQAKLLRELRQAVYRALETMMKSTGCFLETVREEDNLVQEILTDCKPLECKSSLKVQNVAEPSPAKKKKIMVNTDKVVPNTEMLNRVISTCTECALQALYWWTLAAGVKMKSKTFQRVCDFIITTALTVYRSGPGVLFPYNNWKCRLRLLRVLQACVMTPHKEGSSPVQCALAIFKIAEQDDNLQVSSFCIEAQRVCEILIHPRAPCLTATRYVTQEKVTPPVSNSILTTGDSDSQQSGNHTAHSTNHTEDSSHLSLNVEENTDIIENMETGRDEENQGILSEMDKDLSCVEVINTSQNQERQKEVIETPQPSLGQQVEASNRMLETRECGDSIEPTEGLHGPVESVSLEIIENKEQSSEPIIEHKEMHSTNDSKGEPVEKLDFPLGDSDITSKADIQDTVDNVDKADIQDTVDKADIQDTVDTVDKADIQDTIDTDDNTDKLKSGELEDMLMTFADVDPE
ncbi:proline-, glutamic acid- and leucine-rich protein 1-like isoform X2 [Saccostrea echinata]|uniref:proline-, glutamic acid- and leucine-rich protein 1-like isoform X2 n=1 Tax=Saccostrea echinata TaxID=191078 RepID=UPI002A7EBD7F|nr:proline-, glutamic acid- and leucine-rich protein 1-like isoform X2 [Saccostrea echinata]